MIIGETKLLGDFTPGPFFELAKQEDFFELLRKFAETGLKSGEKLAILHNLVGVNFPIERLRALIPMPGLIEKSVDSLLLLAFVSQFLFFGFLANSIENLMTKNPHQPGLGAALAFKLFEAFNGGEECFLHELLCCIGVWEILF